MANGSGAPADPERAERMLAALRLVAAPDGFVPFDRFMDVALYGQGIGYYARSRSPFGRQGDYYTAPMASPLFGRCVAERVLEVLRALDGVRKLRVIELGPGDGTLGEAIVRAIDRDAGLRGRTEYTLVERSTELAVRALDRISHATSPGGVRVTAAPSVGSEGPFAGFVLANEVLDAQPVRRIRWTGEEWVELGVRLQGVGWVPDERRRDRPIPGAAPPGSAPVGTVLEVSPAAEAIVREVADHLTEGLCLVLDYGMEEGELIASHPSGTLAGVRGHRSGGDPYTTAGDADLSAFVNFTRVRSAASVAGLRQVAFRDQAEALGAWGFPRLFEEALREVASPEEEVRLRLAAKNLLFGFERFRALELSAPASEGKLPSAT